MTTEGWEFDGNGEETRGHHRRFKQTTVEEDGGRLDKW